MMRIQPFLAISMLGGISAGLWGLIAPGGSQHSASPRHATQKLVLPAVADDTLSGGRAPTSASHLAADQALQEKFHKAGAEETLRYKVELLERGAEFLKSVPDYTATLQKQEVVGGVLLDEQVMFLKCRHEPFSIYLLWHKGDVGREVLYVEGRHNDKMLAHDGGWKARIPAFCIPTDGWLAMRDARHPVTSAGLLGLIKMMVDVHKDDLARANLATCQFETARQFEGRHCVQFTTNYKSAQESPVYRKSITLIDSTWNVPILSRHFEWPRDGTPIAENELDEATLIESYAFSEIAVRGKLTDHDFDPKNPEYHFR